MKQEIKIVVNGLNYKSVPDRQPGSCDGCVFYTKLMGYKSCEIIDNDDELFKGTCVGEICSNNGSIYIQNMMSTVKEDRYTVDEVLNQVFFVDGTLIRTGDTKKQQIFNVKQCLTISNDPEYETYIRLKEKFNVLE